MRSIYASDKGKPYETITTVIHGYYLNLDNPQDADTWKRIKAERQSQGVRLFDCISDSKHTGAGEEGTIELETDYLFSNQWNTTDGRRVFDWFQHIYPNKRIKAGHLLEITPEMDYIRDNTFKCGYCGAEYFGKSNAGKFCPSCLDSEYLKESDLHLLRVMAISDNSTRKEPTASEFDQLKKDYTRFQVRGNTSRAAIKRRNAIARIKADSQKTITNARIERRGFEWLYKNWVNLENVIFYDHKGVFSFGWRTPLSFGVAQELRQVLANFPYKWEMKTENLGTLTSEEN